MSEPKSRIKAVGLPIFFILVGVFIFVSLRSTRPDADKKEAKENPLVVEVVRAVSEDKPIIIETQGNTIAAQKIELRAEVSGRLVWKSGDLIAGGRFEQGANLARLDGRDYEIVVKQQQAALGRARLELQMESGRKKVAEREWSIMKRKKSGGNTLALREPQLAAAQMNLMAAESGLKKAQLNLDRTTIRAPFNGFVERQNTDVGQVVTPQIALGKFVGSDRFWVKVKVPTHKLQWIAFPKKGQNGSKAKIWQEVGSKKIEREGRVLQLAGSLDPTGRMAQILIEIEDPLALKLPEGSKLPMLLGGYVHVDIEGKTMSNAIEVPRRAVQEGSMVLIMNDKNRLELKKVSIAWRFKDSVFVTQGIKAEERIIVSRIHRPISGTLLKAMEKAPTVSDAQATKNVGDTK